MSVINNVFQRDLQLLLWCVKSHSHHRFILAVKAVSKSGDGYMQIALPLGLWLLGQQNGEAFFWLTCLAFSIERPIYFVLKNTLKRQRPPQVIPCFQSLVTPSDKFSFPSGHTMAAFLLAGLVIYYFGIIAVGIYLWAISVGISRVVLGVHFPTDILAGAFLGTLIAYLVVFGL